MADSVSNTPFSNLVVIELGHSVAAPFAGQIFADMGAMVIKVEKKTGDDARHWGPPFWEGASAFFQSLNRGKYSVVCDLRNPKDLAALMELIILKADVLIQNLRPGQVEELNLGEQKLLNLKPSLIYCNIGAFGKVGPLKDKPGYDPLMQAFGGIMSTTGEFGRPPVRVGASIVDMGTGLWAVIGVLTALLQRQQTGKGQVVDVSLYETATNWVSLLASQYLASGELQKPQGSGAPGIVPYKAYKTKDGFLVVAAGSNGLFQRLAILLGEVDWVTDPRYIDNPSRVENQDVLYSFLDAHFINKSTAHWIKHLEDAGIPCAPVQNLAEMVAHPQTDALELIQNIPGTSMRFFGLPLSINGVRPKPTLRPPVLGEHTKSLLNKVE